MCGKNISSANHYCHDCRTIFCESCVAKVNEEITVCSECGMNLFSTDEKTGTLYCKQCRDAGKENAKLRTIVKERSCCPKCHSTNTTHVDELKSDLKDIYKNIILDCRNILIDFQNFTDFLSLVKQHLMKLRLENPVLIHEPSLETDLLNVMEESTMIERRILNRINNFFLFLKSKQPYFFGNKPWQNEDIAMLETYIHQLQSDFLTFMGQVSESFNQPTDMLATLKTRLDFLTGVKEFFGKYVGKGVITLEKDEFPIISAEDVKLDSDEDDHKGHGHILITNRYFKFIKTQGVVKKSDGLLFSFPLTKLLSTEVTGKVIKRLVLKFQGIELKFNMDKPKMQTLVNYSEQFLDFDRLNKVDLDKVQRIKNFDVNSIFKIKTYIEENINALLNAGDLEALAAKPTGFYTVQDYAGHAGQANSLDPMMPTNGFSSGQESKQAYYPESQLDAARGTYDAIEYSRAANRPPFDDFGGSGHTPVYPKDPAAVTGDPRDFNAYPDERYAPRGSLQHQAQRPAYYAPARQQPPSYQQPIYHPYTEQGSPSPRTAPASQAYEEYDQQAFQARAQKSQETMMIMNALAEAENREGSIQETLRNLESKFETGKVAPSVYFQTHQLFAEKLKDVHRQIEDIKRQLDTANGAYQPPQF
jgi:hypothetical protein